MEERVLDFSLSKTLEYTVTGTGDKAATAEITLGAPCVAAFGPSTKFSQVITRAILEARKNIEVTEAEKEAAQLGAGGDAEGDMDASAVKVFLMASSEDLEAAFVTFKALAAKVGRLDEKTPLKAAHLDKVGYEDALRMMCEYAANFIVPSLFAAESDG